MKKIKKKEVKNKQEEKVEMENYWDVFLRNYNNVPAFKSLVKLIIYCLLIFIFVIVVAISSRANYEDNDNKEQSNIKTTTKSNDTISYQNMLDNILKNNKKIYFEIESDKDKYVIDSEINEGVLSGYFTENKTTKRFKIEDSKIYEIDIDGEIENNELFTNLDSLFIDQKRFIESLKISVTTKEVKEQEIIYNHTIKSQDKTYEVKIMTNSESISKIDISGENIKYSITYK